MEEWKEYKVADVIEDISMGPFGSNIKRDNYVDSGVPYLNGSNLSSYKLNENSFNYVTEEKANNLGRCVAKRGDIIVTHRGTIGQISYIPNDSIYERYLTGNSQFRLTVNRKVIRPDFFVYYFHTRMGQYRILANASQVGVPALARPTSTFKEVLVPVPKMEIQNKIMGILLSLDDKIAVNRRICENLEAQAQALFKHWFIDFAPFKNGNFCANREQNETCFNSAEVQPKIIGKACKFVESELGMIPEGWRVGTLTEIAEYLNGLAMQKFPPLSADDAIPVLKIKELGQSQCDNNSDKCSKQIKSEYIIKNGDVVFSWSGTLMVDIWCGGICGLNQHLFKVTSDNYPKWFYLMWTKHHLAEFIRIAKDKAVTMGHIKRGDLEKALVAIPDSDTLDKMSKVMEDIYNQIINTRLESNSLSTLRDTLLPKLMSGQIKVNEMEKRL